MGRGKPLSELELERIKILAAGGLTDQKIANKINRSRTLVRNAMQNFKKEVSLTRAAFEEDQVQDYTDIIHKGLTLLKSKVETDDMSAVALAKVVGIIFDKRQLVKGSPTVIEENNNEKDESGEAQSIIAAFADFIPQLANNSTEGGSLPTPDVVRINLPVPPSDDKDE